MKNINRVYSKENNEKYENRAHLAVNSEELARLHNWLGLKKKGKSLLTTIKKQSTYIRESYPKINEYYYKTEDHIPAAEWYLDNYYLIKELIDELTTDLSKQFESKLRYLGSGDLAGLPRVYLLVSEYLKGREQEINFAELKEYVKNYQTEAPLLSAEIWAIPIMIKIIMLEKIFYQVEQIIYIQNERTFADNWLNTVFGQGKKSINIQDLDFSKSFSAVYIERVTKRLKEYGTDAKVLLNWLDNMAAKQNMTVEKVTAAEQFYLAANGAVMGNTIAVIKQVNSENWSEFFEEVSLVQQVLKKDPARIFTNMDFESRDKYRHEIEVLATKYNVSEITVAKTIAKLASEAQESPANHVGYYLLGKGKNQLEKELSATWGKVRQSFYGLTCIHRNYPSASYFGSILLFTLLPFIVFMAIIWPQFQVLGLGMSILVGILSLFLFNGIGVYFTNKLFCKLLPVTFLPKLDLSSGIPEEFKTVVVVPAIFNAPEKVRELLKNLETHYLNNKDKNIYFAVLGDYCDAPKEKMPGDDLIIKAGIQGIKRLNSQYGDHFFYFHRKRKWNNREKVWMGWERKRGKIIEFNSLLLGEGDTSYIIQIGPLESLKDITYVITLDADTILPRDGAKRLIGTIAHPMQKAKINQTLKKVEAGYGIIQPRIGLKVTSAFATPFSTMSTGTAGIDPYTCAVSDIYQDLFGEGIFTGKGIYDLKVFHAMTKDRFPENTILSHDLIEGIFARTGLASDILVFDDFPTKFLSFAKRTHRWIRGDWQIGRYLFQRDLSFVSRWKIFDNLRRSLEVFLRIMLLFLAFTFCSQVFVPLILVILLSLGLPLILNILGRIVDGSLTVRILRSNLQVELAQILFSIAVMPYQGYLQIDGVLRSLIRQLFTKRLLLEWETAADSEKQVSLELKTFYSKMTPGLLLAILFGLGFLYVSFAGRIVLAILILTWLGSPLLAYKLSLPYPEEPREISEQDEKELRVWGRQIWAYFENFVNKENNYLPPDNVQLEPYKGAAPRTSPTNIGLAMLANLGAEDLGYISKDTMLKRINLTLETIDKLPKWNGHIYNWYNTNNLEPLHPVYISTVDSGNLATYLITLKNGLREIEKKPILEKQIILQGLKDTCLLIKNEKDAESYEVDCFTKELEGLLLEAVTSESGLWKKIELFIAKWLREFTLLEQEKGTSFWMTCLISMLQDYKKTIARYYPYLKTENLPSVLKDFPNLTLNEMIRRSIDLFLKEEELTLEFKKLLGRGLQKAVILRFKAQRTAKKLHNLAYGMDFKPLFDDQKKLFSIGYNMSEQRLDKSFYDLLASEARQTSLFAIAKGDVPEAHWFKVARPLTRLKGSRSLVSWSGTMFEYLMPLILIKNYRGTLWDESYKSIVRIQRLYGKKLNIPWGISESGFFSFDIQTNYQYKAFGVPGLGLKRGLAKDMVISPYSTFMALQVDFKNSMKNLRLMRDKGINGRYGLYEALDYTNTRVPYQQAFSVVKSYMAHHMGMSLLSINNILSRNKIQERFHREPIIRSVELLLQEQIPLKEYTFNPIIEEVKEEESFIVSNTQGEKPKIYRTSNTKVLHTNLLSNRDYSVMLTLSGSGYSHFNEIFISRWREDPTIDMYGTFIYIQNLNSGEVWSATSKPFDYPGEDYKVTCFPNTVKYSRKDGNILTQMQVFVTPGDPVEVRKVSLTNLSEYTREIQLTSYFEVVLDRLEADIAHPSFSKLFIKTDYEPTSNVLIASRRPRVLSAHEFYLMHTFYTEGDLIGEPEYETDRVKFIGRGRSLANPKALDYNQPLSKSIGAVLDPIMSLRGSVKVGAGRTVNVYFLTGIGKSREEVLELAEKYRNSHTIQQARELSWSQNLMELVSLNLTFAEAALISSLASLVIYPSSVRRRNTIRNNKLGQSSLWAYGISGDYPIVLLKIQDNNQLKMVDEVLKMHEYWKIKGLAVDLVIINEDKTGYFQTLQESMQEKVGISHVRRLVNKPGGVYLLKKDQLSKSFLLLLHTVARIIFSGEKGSFKNQARKLLKLNAPLSEDQETYKDLKTAPGDESQYSHLKNKLQEELLFFNGYGGFSKDGKEYVILINNENPSPLPWVNVIANSTFGTLVSEAGSSYTWSQNSREYKLSSWFNDPLLDISREALYLKDQESGEIWSPTKHPLDDNLPYVARHGQGYSIYEHRRNDIQHESIIHVPLTDNIKIYRLKLTNNSEQEKRLSAYYYIEWVLGVRRDQTAPYLVLEHQDGTIYCRNVYQEEFSERVAFLSSFGGAFQSFTCERKEFVGANRDLSRPLGVIKEKLSDQLDNVIDPCTAIQVEVTLKPGEEKNLYFLIGDEESKEAASHLVQTYQNQDKLEKSYQEVLDFWDDLLTTIKIKTPELTFDLLCNRWLLYQTLACRIWARSAFYQAGGAFGFRDQLQDAMALAVVKPEITRNQIILHSSRQFKEGDVQHWWHPERGKGIRTKFSDDLLWLPL
jgi:cyclic beta-1,2-glucan synthetase